MAEFFVSFLSPNAELAFYFLMTGSHCKQAMKTSAYHKLDYLLVLIAICFALPAGCCQRFAYILRSWSAIVSCFHLQAQEPQRREFDEINTHFTASAIDLRQILPSSVTTLSVYRLPALTYVIDYLRQYFCLSWRFLFLLIAASDFV